MQRMLGKALNSVAMVYLSETLSSMILSPSCPAPLAPTCSKDRASLWVMAFFFPLPKFPWPHSPTYGSLLHIRFDSGPSSLMPDCAIPNVLFITYPTTWPDPLVFTALLALFATICLATKCACHSVGITTNTNIYFISLCVICCLRSLSFSH